MSNIIKNSNLTFAHPRIIEANQKLEEETIAAEIEEELINQEELNQQDHLEAIREESNSILAETEKNIIDLLGKARTEALGIINSAQEDADYIRNQVLEESKSMREKANNQGYADGLKRAQTDIEADRQMALDQSQQIIEEARRTKIEILSSTETDMVRLVLAIAKKVIVADLMIQPEAIVEIVRQAIANLDDPDNLRVYVNPADIPVLTDAIVWSGLTEIGSRDINVEVKGDLRISRGGSVIESAGGTVDARLESRMETMEKAFLDVVNE